MFFNHQEAVIDIFDELLKSSNAPMGSFTWAQIIWSLLLSLALSLLVSEFYKRYGKTASTPANLGPTLVILCLTITFIMEVVGNSVARAFSLAGALSIVRFRNAIKETEDIAVIFLVMAIGLACGSGFFVIAGIATTFILIVWFGLKHFQQISRDRGFDLLHLEAESGALVDEAFKKIRMTAFCTDIALIQTRIERIGNSSSLSPRNNTPCSRKSQLHFVPDFTPPISHGQ